MLLMHENGSVARESTLRIFEVVRLIAEAQMSAITVLKRSVDYQYPSVGR